MKLIEITTSAEYTDQVSAVAEEQKAQDFRLDPADKSGLHVMHMLGIVALDQRGL